MSMDIPGPLQPNPPGQPQSQTDEMALASSSPDDEEPVAADADELGSWKDSLRDDFEMWLHSIEDLPSANLMPESAPPASIPDLYSFFEQLAAANAESKKANRRTAEAFSQWGDTLTHFNEELLYLRNQIGRNPAGDAKDKRLGRSHAMVLIELFDRLQRLARAFECTPPKSWWGNDAAWHKAWDTQRQAFEILSSHFRAFLAQEGITPIETCNQPFDAALMTAVAVESDDQRTHNTVIEEVSAGFKHHGELLRPAQVKVTINKNPSPSI